MKQLFKVVDVLENNHPTINTFATKKEAKEFRDKKNNEYLKKNNISFEKEEIALYRYVVSRGEDHWRGQSFIDDHIGEKLAGLFKEKRNENKPTSRRIKQTKKEEEKRK